MQNIILTELADQLIKQNRVGLIVYLVLLLISHICYGIFSAKPRFNKYISYLGYSLFVVFCVLLAKFYHDFAMLFIIVFAVFTVLYALLSNGNPIKCCFAVTSYLAFLSIFIGCSFALIDIGGPHAVLLRWITMVPLLGSFELFLYLYLIPKIKQAEKNENINWLVMFFGDLLYLIIIYMQVFYPYQLSIHDIPRLIFFLLTVAFYFFVFIIIMNNFTNVTLYNEEIKKNTRLKELAIRDTLTSLYNKNYLATYSESLVNERKDLGADNTIVIIMDINKFKSINDKFGHVRGDEVLKEVADDIKDVFSDDNYKCFRFGGDEFVVIALDKTMDDIKNNVQILKDKLRDTLDIGISAGYNFVDYLNIDPIQTAIKNADKFMYREKFR